MPGRPQRYEDTERRKGRKINQHKINEFLTFFARLYRFFSSSFFFLSIMRLLRLGFVVVWSPSPPQVVIVSRSRSRRRLFVALLWI